MSEWDTHNTPNKEVPVATDGAAKDSLTDQMPPITPGWLKKPEPPAINAPKPEDRERILSELKKATYSKPEPKTTEISTEDES